MDVFSYFSELSGIAGYFAVLGGLLACGLGVPIPEDIILISGGLFAAHNGHGVWPMMAVGLLGILLGDSIVYAMGRRLGPVIAARTPLRHWLSPQRLARVDALFERHGEKILIGARFMPGVRAVAYFSAGNSRVPYWKFVFYDGVAALVSAPLWVYLGYVFGHDVVEWARRSQRSLLLFALALVALWLVYRFIRRRWAARSLAVLAARAREEAGAGQRALDSAQSEQLPRPGSVSTLGSEAPSSKKV